VNSRQLYSRTNPESTPIERHIGKCVYCGSTDNLTDEHIVPYGLNGPWQLLEGSCKACNKITSAFEGTVLHEYFTLARAALGLRTRHRRNRPKEFSFEVDREGRKDTIKVPVTDCPAIFMMRILEEPGYIVKRGNEDSVKTIAVSLHGINPTELEDKFDIEGISINAHFSGGHCFERMLAKIAYGMTILAYGSEALKECYVLPCILGLKHDVGYWVGSSGRRISTLPAEKKVLHRIGLALNNGEIRIFIRLFAHLKTPEYLVIVGKLK
jgi:hypothetical protein